MSTDDRTETITDRAAIRASDEPSERGDFPYYDLGPATSETVGALGDALLGAVNTIKATGGAVEIAGVRIEPCDEFGSTLTTARAENAEHLLRLRSDALARVTREAEALRARWPRWRRWLSSGPTGSVRMACPATHGSG